MAIVFINRTKIEFIREMLANRLRQKILPRMDALLSLLTENFEEGNTKFAIFKLKADLESFMSKSSVLYEVEQKALTDFLTRLSRYISKLDSDSVLYQDTQDLILSGQRAHNEMSELK